MRYMRVACWSRRAGGPSVLSYLPGEKRTYSTDLYRRSVYSVWQRTRFNPLLGTFDAPSREACTVRRPRTNTPLQALALLNETTFVEAARKLAERMMTHGTDDTERLIFGFQCALARKPNSDELTTLKDLLTKQRRRLMTSPNWPTNR